MKKLNILYCHGLGSSIHNRTAQGLHEYFKGKQHNFERLQYENAGREDKVWRVDEWKRDILKKIEGKEWILIAQSAGAQAALNAAKENPRNIKGLFLFCPGYGLGYEYVNQVYQQVKESKQHKMSGVEYLETGKTFIHPASRNGNPSLVDLEGFTIFRDTCVSKDSDKISINCPVHIIHGTEDQIVPYDNSIQLCEKLQSSNVTITLLKGKDHYVNFDEVAKANMDVFLDQFNEQQKAKI